MKAILYTNTMEEPETGLGTIISEQIPGIRIKTMDSIKQLSQLLCQPLNGISVILIFIHSMDELEQFIDLTHFFDNIRLILVLPDRIKSTMALGLRLNPCFISYLDSDMKEIISVLKKIDQRRKKIYGQVSQGTQNYNCQTNNNSYMEDGVNEKKIA